MCMHSVPHVLCSQFRNLFIRAENIIVIIIVYRDFTSLRFDYVPYLELVKKKKKINV